MPLMRLLEESETSDQVRKIFKIAVRRQRKVFGLDEPAYLWRSMARLPDYLEANFDRLRAIMLRSKLSPSMREAIASAVSIINVCHY